MPAPVVAIIVPVFNVYRFLPRCISSLMMQDFDNFEVILVDDGSSDGSERTCDQVAALDSRFRVIHQQNAGLSAARNEGVIASSATYITFVDSDDVVRSDHVRKLVTPLLDNVADLSVTQAQVIPHQDSLHQLTREAKADPVILSQEDALHELLLQGTLSVSACSKMTSREKWLRNPFPPGRYYEDLATMAKMISHSSRVSVSQELTYGQVMRSGSITRSVPTNKHIADMDFAISSLVASIAPGSSERIKTALSLAQAVEGARLLRLGRQIVEPDTTSKDIIRQASQSLNSHLIIVNQKKVGRATTRLKLKIAALSPSLYDSLFNLLQLLKRYLR